MERTRRIELGAGIGAAVLGVVGLVALMFAPIIAHCVSGPLQSCPRGDLRYTSLLQTQVDASVWAIVIGMLLLVLIGAAGAIAEARFGLRGGVIPLWSATIMALAGCVFVQGIGLFYFPAIFALVVAGIASRMRQRALAQQAHEPISDEAGSQPGDDGTQDSSNQSPS